MTSFKLMATQLVVAGALAFSSLHAQAAAVQIDFQGTISSITNAAFSTLLSVGQAVSATVVFNVNPPGGFNGLSDSVDPGDSLTVDGAPVTGFTSAGAGYTNSSVFYYFQGGSGPSAVVGSSVLDVDGIYFRMSGINGFTATLADYLALPSSAFTAVLRGESIHTGGWSTIDSVAELSLTSASYRLASPVPEPGTLLLLGLGLAGLAAARRYQH